MNKKVVTFLSLFSLVLILSIYYVVSPFGTNLKNDDTNVNVVINQESDAYFTSLEVTKNENYDLYIEEMNAIIASSNHTNEEKRDALVNIEKAKNYEFMDIIYYLANNRDDSTTTNYTLAQARDTINLIESI